MDWVIRGNADKLIDTTTIIEASEITLDEPIAFKMPKKIKGKEVSYSAYRSMLHKFYEQRIDGKRNPFWQSRY